MDNKFFMKGIAVKGRPIFGQYYTRRLKADAIERITSNDNSCEMSQRFDELFKRITEQSYKSINRKYKTNVFKCRFIECRKRFFARNSWILHQKQHQLKNKTKKSFLTTVPTVSGNTQIDKIGDPLDGQPLNGNQSSIVTTTNESIDRSLTPVVSHGFSSVKSVKMYFTTDRYLGQKRCICDFCGHKSYGIRSSSRMAVHINGKHLRNLTFICDVEDCRKVFYAPNSLRYHKMNHFCGFGIKNGKTLETICGNQSINRYRKQIIIKGVKVFKCVFNGCQYITTGTAIKRHIHDQHLCPNRIILPKRDLTLNSIDILSRFDDFCQMIDDSEGQQLYKCKSCQFFTEKMIGFLSHIKLKHFSIQNNFEVLKSVSTQQIPQNVSETIDCQNNSDSEETEIDFEQQYEEQPKIPVTGLKVTKKELRPKKKKTDIIWMPFNCTECGISFDDLVVLRNHLKCH